MRIFMLPVMLLALALGGCLHASKSVLVGGSSLTATIANPVRSVDIFRVKNVYAATLELAVQYRTYCWSKPFKALLADPVAAPICKSRRQVVRAIQTADKQAFAAIEAADNFVQSNPTLSATSLIGAAWSAVSNFQSKVPIAAGR